MQSSFGSLPEFENPPVTEVAISVMFRPLAAWKGPFAGIYWQSIRADYPKVEVQLPLPSQVEEFGSAFWKEPEVRFELPDPDLNRYWFLYRSGSRLIQLQKDRFVINWRKRQEAEDEVYPRYSKGMRPRFEKEWSQFRTFVSTQQLGDIDVQQCEIIYVNDIAIGQGWNRIAELGRIFSPWTKEGGDFLPDPGSISVASAFEFPDRRGRLHLNLQHLLRKPENREVIQLRLTARGKPVSSDDKDILAWFDTGREWIVRGFTELTTKESHKMWGRTR